MTPMAEVARHLCQAAAELADEVRRPYPEKAARFEALRERFRDLASADAVSEREILAASPVVVTPSGVTVALVELLRARRDLQGIPGWGGDAEALDATKRFLECLAWCFPGLI